jgi:hypothetical protein
VLEPDGSGQEFRVRPSGNGTAMIAAFIAMVVLAVIFIFLVPWVGILAGIVALILLVLFLVGVGRGVTHDEPPPARP